MSTPAIAVRDLRKSYGSVPAVRGVDFEVSPGEVVAMLGPNGAGKTTTIEILEGFRRRDAGTVSVLGHDPATAARAVREQVGIVLQDGAVERFLTVREMCARQAGYYRRRRDIDEVLDLVGLTEKAGTRVKQLSGGQQRRLDLALGLVGDPDLIFLDEPTTGFDPGARRQSWDVVKGLCRLGKTVLLTTHYMDEAQALADRVIVIAGGLIVAEGDPHTIGGRDRAAAEISFAWPPTAGPGRAPNVETDGGEPFDDPASLARLRTLNGLDALTRGADGRLTVRTATPTAALAQLCSWAVEQGVELERLTVTRPSLEDVYLQLTDTGVEHGA